MERRAFSIFTKGIRDALEERKEQKAARSASSFADRTYRKALSNLGGETGEEVTMPKIKTFLQSVLFSHSAMTQSRISHGARSPWESELTIKINEAQNLETEEGRNAAIYLLGKTVDNLKRIETFAGHLDYLAASKNIRACNLSIELLEPAKEIK